MGPPPCDLLSIITGDPAWAQYRGGRVSSWLNSQGIAAGSTNELTEDALRQSIILRKPRVVLDECATVLPPVWESLANEFPAVRFVSLYHGSPAWVASMNLPRWASSLRLSINNPNCYLGYVANPNSLIVPATSKTVYLPNLIHVPDVSDIRRTTSQDEGLLVSIVARANYVKNWGGMLSAIGVLAGRRKVKALVVSNGQQESIASVLDSFSIMYEALPWGDWETTLRAVAERVHVGLACGFSDAFNLIGAEHCLMGIPVVGSPSMDWLPKKWQINPQDPVAMADLVEKHAADKKAGEVGKRLVTKIAKTNETTFIKNISALLE
jgi:hypothetical protein